jgi:hypothetical protein
VTNSGFSSETTGGGRMKIKEKEMKVSQSYRAALATGEERRPERTRFVRERRSVRELSDKEKKKTKKNS